MWFLFIKGLERYEKIIKQKLKIKPKNKENFEKLKLVLKTEKSKPEVNIKNNAHKKKEVKKEVFTVLLMLIEFLINKELISAKTRGKNRYTFTDINFKQAKIFIC